MNIKGLMTYIVAYTVSRDNGFPFETHELFDCCVQAPLSVITCRCEQHDLVMF